MILLFILIPLAFSAGCSRSSGPVFPEHVRNLADLTVYPVPADPDTLILHREQTFGVSDSNQIGQIRDIAVDDSGRVFIGDGQKQVIHIFAPDGRLITQLGREGRGPAEFNTITKTEIRHNRLYVYDAHQLRVNVFSLDSLTGRNTITLATNRGGHRGLSRAFPGISELLVRNDHRYLAGFTVQPASQEVSRWKNREFEQRFYLLDREGNISSQKLFTIEETRTNFGGIIANITVLFGQPRAVIASDNTTFLYEDPGHFLIKKMDSSGAYQRAFYYPCPGVPLTEKTAHEGGITGAMIRKNVLLNHMKRMDLPEMWPVLADMKIDDQDRLWVATTVKNMKVHRWWVMQPDGRVIARIHWPKHKPIQEIKNGKLYTLETSIDTGTAQVVRYRIALQQG